jgi:hypothetical protein
MGKKWGKNVMKTKRKMLSDIEAIKLETPAGRMQSCKATPDVCIVRQARNASECAGCSIMLDYTEQ